MSRVALGFTLASVLVLRKRTVYMDAIHSSSISDHTIISPIPSLISKREFTNNLNDPMRARMEAFVKHLQSKITSALEMHDSVSFTPDNWTRGTIKQQNVT